MRIQLVFLAVLLGYLGVTVLAKWQEGPYYDPARKTSLCGRNVTGWRNYLNSVYDVPLQRVAEVILGDFVYIHQYRDILLKSKFAKLAEATESGKMGPWRSVNDTWKERKVGYERELYNNPFIKHVSMDETYRAFYSTEMLILNKHVRNKGVMLSGFYLLVDYCGVAWGEDRSHVEVDTILVFESPPFALIRGSIENGASDGFVEVYGSLDIILKQISANPGTARFPLNAEDFLPSSTLFHGTSPFLPSDSVHMANDDDRNSAAISPVAESDTFWTKPKKIVVKFLLGSLIVISFIVVCIYIFKKMKEMDNGDRQIVAIYKVEDDGFETVELETRREDAPLQPHE